MTLFPVILSVAEPGHELSGREKVSRLSKISREALRLSAEKGGVVLGELRKDENDVPRPFNGNYWSISHKSKYVAAVIGEEKIGIDIEEIRPRSESIFSLVASEEEWALGKDRRWGGFFRYWTAKEATLKAIGIGIGGLKTCRVVSVPDDNHILLDYGERLFQVEQLYYRNHIVSVLKGENEIEWIIRDDCK
jgi:4'-phosphopantetheinyl transferase